MGPWEREMTIPTLTTARLLLRPFCEADALPLHRVLAEEGVLRYFPNPEPPSLERMAKFVDRQLAHWQEHGYGWWAVEPVARPAPDFGHPPGIAGWIGLTFLPETGETEVAYLLAKPLWGQGLAVEGGRAALLFGFETCGLDPIIAVVHPDNRRSIRVIEKLGMAFTARTQYFGMDVLRYVLHRADLPSRDVSHSTS